MLRMFFGKLEGGIEVHACGCVLDVSMRPLFKATRHPHCAVPVLAGMLSFCTQLESERARSCSHSLGQYTAQSSFCWFPRHNNKLNIHSLLLAQHFVEAVSR